MAQHRNKACKAIESGIAGYPGGKNCLSARAAIRGKRATKNIRKCRFPVVFFGLLGCTNRSFCAFPEVLFDLLPGTNRSFCIFPEVLFDLLRRTNRMFFAFPVVLFGLLACTNRSFLLFYEVFFGLLPSTNRMFYALPDACYHPFNQYAPEHPIFEKRT